ncbi:MAG TPA: histidinol dehydrogenase, partial [Dehalococcoidia bacterium]|nr:histidinol dehydrogenase [Dehalococcoidia bacterium]
MDDLPPQVRDRLRAAFAEDLSPEEAVRRIIAGVRERGDDAVRRYGDLLDGREGPAPERTRKLIVTRDEIDEAYGLVDESVVETLRRAAERIRTYHQRQRAHAATSFVKDGVGQLVSPLDRVGLYVPGTAVVYPSTVLMTALPARVAGTREVVMASPAGPDGRVAPIKLVAADIAGVDWVVRAGGAQAIAALAYGTESIPSVDKICGPGNLFVTLAKRAVFGDVGVDGVYGPSETIVIADDSALPELCAADLLAQAEHDELATPILLTTSATLAEATVAEVERQLRLIPRAEVARTALSARGGIAVLSSLEEAIALANDYAPEHLCLLVRDAEALLP